MKFGVREICDVVLRAKANQKIGNKTFFKHEPVCYFDTLKTSTLEGAVTTVYAQGGRGNARLIAWDGERTVTFTMEDALISPLGFAILSGAGIVEATADKPVIQHCTEMIAKKDVSEDNKTVTLGKEPYFVEGEITAYAFTMKDGNMLQEEPYLLKVTEGSKTVAIATGEGNYKETAFEGDFDAILVDYYTAREGGASQIEITAEKFGGNFYLEASTLFRNQDGVDLPAEFIIPNCKVQSNFTFTMASSGDPSTFTFTMDAFPDYTRWDPTQKVLCAIQIIEEADTDDEAVTGHRENTPAGDATVAAGE